MPRGTRTRIVWCKQTSRTSSSIPKRPGKSSGEAKRSRLQGSVSMRLSSSGPFPVAPGVHTKALQARNAENPHETPRRYAHDRSHSLNALLIELHGHWIEDLLAARRETALRRFRACRCRLGPNSGHGIVHHRTECCRVAEWSSNGLGRRKSLQTSCAARGPWSWRQLLDPRSSIP